MNTALKSLIFHKFRFQGDFARKAGISDSRLSGIIRGRKAPTQEEMQNIAKTLGVKADEIFNTSSLEQ